jgi:hypothetical protein
MAIPVTPPSGRERQSVRGTTSSMGDELKGLLFAIGEEESCGVGVVVERQMPNTAVAKQKPMINPKRSPLTNSTILELFDILWSRPMITSDL